MHITGGELAEGQPLSRQPWKDWTELRELVVEEHNFPSLNPVAFVMNKVLTTLPVQLQCSVICTGTMQRTV